MDGREFPPTPARPKTEPKEGMTRALKIKTPKTSKTDRPAKTVKKLRVKSTAPVVAPVVAPTQTPGWDVVDTSTEPTLTTKT